MQSFAGEKIIRIFFVLPAMLDFGSEKTKAGSNENRLFEILNQAELFIPPDTILEVGNRCREVGVVYPFVMRVCQAAWNGTSRVLVMIASLVGCKHRKPGAAVIGPRFDGGEHGNILLTDDY